MFKFFTESIKEFEHVVWPTKAEARKYFSIVVWLIISLTIFIFLVSTIFSTVLFYAKDAVNPSKLPATTTQTPKTTNTTNSNSLKLDNIKVNTWSTK